MNDPALFQSRKARLIPGDLIFYWGGGFLSWATRPLNSQRRRLRMMQLKRHSSPLVRR